MANFDAVLRRAVENLDNNDETARWALYDKAKAALLTQLRSLDPPPSEAELERQSQALDAAIAEIEADYAAEAASPREPDPAPQPEPEIPEPPPDPEPEVPEPSPGPEPEIPDTEPGPELPEPPPMPGPEIPDVPPQPGPEIPSSTPQAGQPASGAAPAYPVGRGSDEQDELAASPAHQSFRSAIAETENLGGASTLAARSARDTLGRFDSEETAERQDGSMQTEHDASAPGPVHVANDDRARGSDEIASMPPPPLPPRDKYHDDPQDGDGGRGGRIAMWLIVLLVIGGLLGVGYWQRDTLMEMAGSFTEEPQEAVEEADEAKIADRVTAPDAEEVETPPPSAEPEAEETAPSEQQGEDVAPAQEEVGRTAQALLIEQAEAGSSTTNTLGGSVDWALLDDPEAPAGAQKVIRATVRVPDKGVALALAIRRNTDEELPASHTVEILFDLPPDFENGGIKGVPGIIMKATPQSQGQPLIGAVVPVTDNFFLVGLSESQFDRERNISELKRRNFIDVPMVYEDDSRAVLSLAKGESGDEVFSQAFAAWEQ